MVIIMNKIIKISYYIYDKFECFNIIRLIIIITYNNYI